MKSILIFLVYVYRWCTHPIYNLLPFRICKFEPSCSQYMIDSIKKYGPFKGVPKGLWRICRCNPCTCGGHDPA